MKAIILVTSILFSLNILAQDQVSEAVKSKPLTDKYKSAREKFNKLSPEHKDILRERYRKYLKLPPAAKEILQKRHIEWKKLSPENKKRLKRQYKQFKDMDKVKRERLLERLKKFQKMSPEEREKRLDKLKALKRAAHKGKRDSIERKLRFLDIIKGRRDPRKIRKRARMRRDRNNNTTGDTNVDPYTPPPGGSSPFP